MLVNLDQDRISSEQHEQRRHQQRQTPDVHEPSLRKHRPCPFDSTIALALLLLMKPIIRLDVSGRQLVEVPEVRVGKGRRGVGVGGAVGVTGGGVLGELRRRGSGEGGERKGSRCER
jgi:hypothetical protein